jgi:hypothetical protein
MLWQQGPFEPNPYLINATIANNPAAALVEGPVGLVGDAKVIAEVKEILKSKQLLIDAFDAGKSVDLKIAGRTINIEPSNPYSGFTLFGENSFSLGKEAFQSNEELTKTLLHELYRLQNSAKTATSGAKVTKETHDAWSFAEKMYNAIFK